ncbi:ribosome biogenesis protein UTP30 [Geosmithia morbida]|uniref:Ribosome biogenesis protein UTP30 n=1 Tax=Geosmithia morbida TaxID=1094350 RepID=A0A9P4YW37_9HYPO|nr:ribosome biogenesis protein UTP30 [Geosmithia morbida]KAF4123085.1 ribosome biogenesis protein UTP30 [Geosmithia morbida]
MAPSKQVVAISGDKTVSPVSSDQTLKASKALLSHIKKAAQEKAQDSSKRNLLDDDDAEGGSADADSTPIWLTLTTKRHIVDKTRLQPGRIPLPHSLNADQPVDICLITADPQRTYKDIVASDEFPAELRARVGRVIGFSKLKAKFSQYEAQRRLLSEHDIFLADDRIINRIPKVLGKTFFKTTAKRPIPVVLSPKDSKKAGVGAAEKKAKKAAAQRSDEERAAKPAQIAHEIEKALSSALVSLSPTTNTAVRVGYAGWAPEKVADNVDAVAAALVDKWVPQKWNNVRGLYIKGPESAALPIWLTDELWVDSKDVLSNEAAAAIKDKEAEKANVGKKRKSVTESGEAKDEAEGDSAAAPAKKAKKGADKPKKEERKDVPEGDDGKLDKQISDRKSRLRKQKAAARKSVD